MTLKWVWNPYMDTIDKIMRGNKRFPNKRTHNLEGVDLID